MAQTLTNIILHVVFSTKNRAKDLDHNLRGRLWPYISKILQNRGGRVYLVNGGLEHVHLLFRQPADRATSDLLRDVKANASRWIHKQFPQKRHFAWQRGYSAFSVSHSHLDGVYQYVASQEEHHRRQSFEDELLSLLKKNELEFEEKYLWQ